MLLYKAHQNVHFFFHYTGQNNRVNAYWYDFQPPKTNTIRSHENKTLIGHVIYKHKIDDLLKESTHYRYWLHFLCQKSSPGVTKRQKTLLATKSYDYSKTIRRVREKEEEFFDSLMQKCTIIKRIYFLLELFE